VAEAGFLITVFAVGMIIGSPTMAMLTRRMPRRRTLVFALGCSRPATSSSRSQTAERPPSTDRGGPGTHTGAAVPLLRHERARRWSCTAYDEPEPGPGQTLHDVSTAAINYADTHQQPASN
jgi:hypothetical protein